MSGFFYKEGQGSGITMQEVFLPDQPDFAVAEKSGQTERSKLRLDMPGVVTWFAKEPVPAAIATAETASQNRFTSELLVGVLQDETNILGPR